MIGYTPAEQRIRADRGDPPAAGRDDEATWHQQPATQAETRAAA